MVQVKFLKTKRFPHPDGLKRQPGETAYLPADLAALWEANGIVEIHREPTVEVEVVVETEPTKDRKKGR